MTETGEHIQDIRQTPESGQCLDPEWIRLLVDGDVSPARIAQIEEHLATCAKCRAQLEKESGGAALWELARKSLAAAVQPGAENDASPGGSHPADPMLSLLEPSNNPEMLGSLGAYEIAGVLGKGGMGVVLKAYDPALGRYVAIKLLAPHLAANPNARKRFAREAKAAAAVAHDHVIAIHGISEFKGIPYLVMPLIRGESLQKRLRAEGQLPVEVILRIAMQTASGLAAAHAQGLIHRDVKPANILLGPGTERVTLTDFGLARAVDEVDLTVTGMLPGTPRYMSPEQARGEILDARTDLFSLGLVLYEMAAGQSPFRADSSYAVLRNISEAEPKALGEFRSDLPDWLVAIIARLLAKNPIDRLASARDLERLLAEGLAHLQSPKSNAAPRLGLLTQAVPAPEKVNEADFLGQTVSSRESASPPVALAPAAMNWIAGRPLAAVLLLALVFFFFYPLIQGEVFAVSLGLAIIAGLMLFFGPWGLAYRSKALVSSYTPGRRGLQMGVFALAVFGVGFLIYNTEKEIAKMHGAVWNQTHALQARHDEWGGVKGAVPAKQWKTENDLIEYAQSTVSEARLHPGQAFNLFAGVLVLAILMLAIWGLTFWNRCHPGWIVAGLVLAAVWTFHSLIQAETTVHRVIGEVNAPEILRIARPNAPIAFADPVVVIADKKDDKNKELQIHIKPGYVVMGVMRVRENGFQIADMSIWAGQGNPDEGPLRVDLQYKVASDSTPSLEKKTPSTYFRFSGEPKNLNGVMELGTDNETVMEGSAHEVWAFPETEVGNTLKTVSLIRIMRTEPVSPKTVTTHWDLTLKVAKLPPTLLPELRREFVYKGLHWNEDEWRKELGIDNVWIINDLNESGRLIHQDLNPSGNPKKIPQAWTITLPPGMVVDLLPVEMEQQSTRPIEMLRAYCYNQTEKTIRFQYSLFLETEPDAPWPKEYPRLTAEVSSGRSGSEFPTVKTNGNPLWLQSRHWMAEPEILRGFVRTAWIKALNRGYLPAYRSQAAGGVKGKMEVRVRYHPISTLSGTAPIGTGIGTPWWTALHQPDPVVKEAAQRDELVDLELSTDGASAKVLGLNVPLSVVGPLIAKDGFSKNAGLLLRCSPETPPELINRAAETFKRDGYRFVSFVQKEPPMAGAKETAVAQFPAKRTEMIVLRHIAADDCAKVIEETFVTDNRGGAPASGKTKQGTAKKLDVKVVADPRTNSIFLVGLPADLEKIKDVVKQLDAPPADQKKEEKKNENQKKMQ